MASRLTYRKPAAQVAWQRQIRDDFDSPAPTSRLKLKQSTVRSVSRRLAESIILKYEWLGTMASTSVHYGIFFDNHCAGVCCVALGGSGTAGPTVGRKFGLEQRQIATLARGACVHWAPSGANSRLVAWTCRLLAKQHDDPEIVVAYSDSDAGEIGTIYQACGWVYIGKTKRPSSGEYVSRQGRVINSQTVGHWARRSGLRFSVFERILIDKGWSPQASNPKGIYVKPLRRGAISDRVYSMGRPYPKRAGSIDSDVPGDQPGEGGADPTPALQKNDALQP